jgi:5-methylthioadenosine/S-adenosylhomocysteine deaminase
MMNTTDLLFTNGIVMTMDSQNAIIENGAVAVTGGTIAAVGTAKELASVSAGETIDAKGGIIMPGLVNTHTHAAMTLFRGLADDLPLMTWLNDHIFPAEAQLDENKVLAGSLLGLRGDDSFRNHLFLRHVPVRGCRGPRRQIRRNAGGGG